MLESNDYPRCKGASPQPPGPIANPIIIGEEDDNVKLPAAPMASSSSTAAAASSSSTSTNNEKPSAASSSSSSSAPDVSYQIVERNRKLERKAEEYRSKTTPTSDQYRLLAIHHLTLLFPSVNMNNIRETFEKNAQQYFKTREALRKIVYGALLDPEEACKTDTDKVIEENIKKAG